MKLRKKELKGTGKVYRFTLVQLLKSRANLITLIIMLLFACFSIPVVTFVNGASEEDDSNEEAAEQLSEAESWMFQKERLDSLGITEEQLSLLNSAYTVSHDTVENYREAAHIGADTSFAVQYIYAILVLILCTFSTTFIVRAVIEEKASRLVETLLLNVRPLALILGKILAVMTYVFGILFLMAAGAFISWKLTCIFMDGSVIRNMASDMGLTSEMLRFGPLTIAIVLISLALGYFTFSIIGGIAGACCSSMEDVESANLSVLLFVMGGYMVSCFTAAFSSLVGQVISFIPFVSVFCAPVQYVLGNISFSVLCLAWLVQLLLLFVLVKFGAAVYGDLIMYRGSRLKAGKLLSMAKGKKNGGVF